ncbi:MULTISPECIES: DUF4348 domain-containing protein [Flavobacterium]|nr:MULTISPECIES: DUF4348 domain-containing protein [Flavobacterium]
MIKSKNRTVLSNLIKQFLFGVSCILCFFSMSCKNDSQKEVIEVIEVKKDTIELVDTKQVVEAERIEEDFLGFLEKFSKNHLFQVERVNFPLVIQHLDTNGDFELVELEIKKEDYSFLNFMQPAEYLDYKQNFVINDNEAIVENRGIGNGIMIDYYFKKEHGIWKLKTWIDRST